MAEGVITWLVHVLIVFEEVHVSEITWFVHVLVVFEEVHVAEGVDGQHRQVPRLLPQMTGQFIWP